MKKTTIAKITDIEDLTYFDLMEIAKRLDLDTSDDNKKNLCCVLEFLDGRMFHVEKEIYDDEIHFTLFLRKHFNSAKKWGCYGSIDFNEEV